VRTDLQSAALPLLTSLASDLGMTAFLVVRAGDEAVTVTSVEPPDSAAHVAYRPGTRHPVGRGAPGLALLVPEAPAADDRDALTEARLRGWATSHGEVIPGIRSIAAPVVGPDGAARGALAVVFVDDGVDTEAVGHSVVAAAAKVAAGLR
jgi:DNA-binding IclR family transcriptional regulator